MKARESTLISREMNQTAFGAWYQKFIPLVDSGTRGMFTIVE